ncbi:MAG: XdhC family protein, partial [Mycobacteriales bacterium]
MRDILGSLRDWYDSGQPFGLATVVGVTKSAPRQPGAAMAVRASGEAVGSVSGGCVEGAVYDLATSVLAGGEPVLHTFGYTDDDAFAVGLTCGGAITMFVQAVNATSAPELDDVLTDIDAGRPVAVATVIDGGTPGRRLA